MIDSAPDTMTEPAYTVRNSLIDKARTFSQGVDVLHWSEAGGESQFRSAHCQSLNNFDPAAQPPELIGTD